MLKRVKTSGFMFVGDPHISSNKPGRRKDKDYTATILGKLEQVVEIANSERLVIIILGDLFDRYNEGDHSVMTRLMRIFKKAWTKPYCLTGNHDTKHEKLSDDDALAVLSETNIVNVINEDYVPTELFNMPDTETVFAVGGTPYGQEIPDDVTDFCSEADSVIWITHENLSFFGSYPRTRDLFEIKGARFAVNGHMHTKTPHQTFGETTWFNPGNITRKFIDAIDHKPAVLVLTAKSVKYIPLKYEEDIFDLTGYHVDSAEDVFGDLETNQSMFANLIGQEINTDLSETSDGDLLSQDMLAMFKERKTSEPVKEIIIKLLESVVAMELLEEEKDPEEKEEDENIEFSSSSFN